MSALDKRNFAWYDSLTPEEQKGLSMWVVMRYAASTNNSARNTNEHYLKIVNDYVNVGFNDLRHHPELQWRLMQLAGIGKDQFHNWIKPMKKKKDDLKASNKLLAFYSEMYPFANDQELAIIISNCTKAEIKTVLTEHGLTPAAIKVLMK